ncbi:FAD-dependent oxidoreductase-like enzyme [Hirsutella rhossiliensis]|uniref:FAD-dependent oxidoreductase-like enzyme n=1 Tax=Hirsutella rhossiliensis TaxID=111463 RepID=A0A9P8MUP0_9HYPO|nr:FAD-dependent oxidoreductase-like enzyme [Hirsutella rhossiliensis]KAH0961545.1 FAD-dependent oxidoreductase-like enzyme [Hirsutella rhossiliensis]
MASDAESAEAQQPHPSPSPVDEPTTPDDSAPPPPLSLSQVTLPSTEIPASPIDASQSFQTEPLDDRPPPAAATIIPSSLTPPPSTQVAAHDASRRSLFSPPATVLALTRHRGADSDPGFVPPTPQQVLDAPPDELRAMLQTCIAEHQKLKMEAAHHKLQYNLLSMQADEDSKRAVVEHDMVRREVDALRLAEHTRQARRELSTSSDSTQAKYLQMKTWYQEAVQETDALRRRLKAAKRVIHQKEEETISLSEERDLLLTRIRENREHFHMLCSPGGIFHGALTPKPQTASTPQQQRLVPQHPPKAPRRDERHVPEHGLSALIQAMSAQDNNSAPSTPRPSHRVVQRKVGKHSRNAQSMSSLPTTPLNRTHDPSLLPSVDLMAPHTEPHHRLAHPHVAPTTPKRDRRRKSRESTISAEDNEELARQAMESAAAAQSIASEALRSSQQARPRARDRDSYEDDGGDEDGGDVLDSQASQAAAELLRRNPGQRYDTTRSAAPRDRTPRPAEKSARMQARLLSDSGEYSLDKRKYGGGGSGRDTGKHEQGSPPKKMRVGGPLTEDQRVGLGIQYGQ